MNRCTVISSACLILLATTLGRAAEKQTFPIDLPTALKLAGAQNLDVQLARERLTEARANHDSAVNQFFPWISPGVGYRRHDGQIQDVAGNIFNASKQSYTIGGALNAQLDLGDAYYKSLATRQISDAAGHALEVQRQESAFTAATGYFELARARSSVGVATEGLRIARDYADELDRAVQVGVAFKGDALRARVQVDRNDLAVRQAEESQHVASARLAQTLHLDPAVELVPQEADLTPLTLVSTNAPLDSLVAQALANRPEFKQNKAQLSAARESRDGAVYGPIVPTVGAQMYLGGVGGGRNSSTGNFGDTEDFFLGLSWRIGPGGLFDKSRIRAADSRVASARLSADKVRDQVIGQVVEAHVHMQSLADQIGLTRRALTSAEATLRLTRERKEFVVGIVLENIQSEQELTRSRNDYLNAVAEYDKAQYALRRAIGAMASPASTSGPATAKMEKKAK